jgi:glutathione S-transferase
MKLYYAPASSYSQRVLIALYEKQAEFTPIEVNLFDATARDRYTQINPFAKVPTLETDQGDRIFEACCIIEYLDRHLQTGSKLISNNPELALEIRIIERTIDVYINNGREALFADTQCPEQERGGKDVIKAQRLLETACRLLDDRLQHRPWLGGETFSLADCAAAPTLAYLRLVYSYQHLPHLTHYVRRLEARPSVARALSQGRAQMMQMLSSLRYPLELVPLDDGATVPPIHSFALGGESW